jgi:translation initiation factor IF-3
LLNSRKPTVWAFDNGENNIRRPTAAQPAAKDGLRVNEEIRASIVLLIDENGEKQGEMSLDAAMSLATGAGLDLVEIVATANPPVTKIMDYGKFKFQEQKKRNEARKRQKIVELKEVKLRPMIDIHDYQVKSKAMHRFFAEGDKVKVTMRFRGREMAHQHLGLDLLIRLKNDFAETAKVEAEPRLEGRQMTMVMAPKNS